MRRLAEVDPQIAGQLVGPVEVPGPHLSAERERHIGIRVAERAREARAVLGILVFAVQKEEGNAGKPLADRGRAPGFRHVRPRAFQRDAREHARVPSLGHEVRPHRQGAVSDGRDGHRRHLAVAGRFPQAGENVLQPFASLVVEQPDAALLGRDEHDPQIRLGQFLAERGTLEDRLLEHVLLSDHDAPQMRALLRNPEKGASRHPVFVRRRAGDAPLVDARRFVVERRRGERGEGDQRKRCGRTDCE